MSSDNHTLENNQRDLRAIDAQMSIISNRMHR